MHYQTGSTAPLINTTCHGRAVNGIQFGCDCAINTCVTVLECSCSGPEAQMFHSVELVQLWAYGDGLEVLHYNVANLTCPSYSEYDLC
jgi:hypothetical protein